MKKRSKTKKQKQKTLARPKAVKVKQYEPHYLAIILIAFLMLEGFLFSFTQPADWQNGFAVLDMSSNVTQTVSDIHVAIQPVLDAIEGVDQFYQYSATAMTEILDISGTEPMSEVTFVAESVLSFYEQAGTEMASLLDFSSVSSWPARVAGASLEIRN